MIKSVNKLVIITLTLVVLSCASNQPEPIAEMETVEAPKAEYVLNSSEYKLLLNPEMFTDFAAGFANYWKIINEVAVAEGIDVIAKENPMKLKHKDVSFLIPKPGFEKTWFLLRQKMKYKDGEIIAGYEYGLKFRNQDPATALSMDLTLAEGYVPKFGKIELESDIVYYSVANGSTHTTYTVSNSIELDDQPKMVYKSFLEIYPALSILNLPVETELKLVSGASANEWMVVPGELDFGDGLFGRMDMTVWLIDTAEGVLSIPEFSFDHVVLKIVNMILKPWNVAVASSTN